MKFIILISILSLNVTLSFAQGYIVYDPQNYNQNIISDANRATEHLETLNKWKESIEKANTMIEKANEQIQKLQTVVTTMGNPTEAASVISGLGGVEPNIPAMQLMNSLAQSADGLNSLQNNMNGLYQSIPQELPSGSPIKFDANVYKPFAAVENNLNQFQLVFQQSDTKATSLLQQIKTLTEKPAASEAEQREKQAAIAAKQAELSLWEQRRQSAFMQLEAQKLANENQQQKEDQAEYDKRSAQQDEEIQNMQRSLNSGY